ncbi:recombinase family protein [Dyella sp. M7H15-1]|uniref:recombinase family protein n=1 Tax=Dyella sp. M7H15-1 TaxID=2501295 RepID=UPI00197A72D4|nr:recombinase family protein [Dyella sp. M7H15-1]
MVALYARVSSEQQNKRGTIESQLAALKERISADGAQIADDMCFVDAGVSGATLIRPQLERLRDCAALSTIDQLYILSPDRLARKYAHQALLMEEFTACGMQVVFLNHAIGASPEESLLLQMQGMIAEYERAKITERHRRGKLHGAKRGSVNVLSGAPYGYRYIILRTWGGLRSARRSRAITCRCACVPSVIVLTCQKNRIQQHVPTHKTGSRFRCQPSSARRCLNRRKNNSSRTASWHARGARVRRCVCCKD